MKGGKYVLLILSIWLDNPEAVVAHTIQSQICDFYTHVLPSTQVPISDSLYFH